MEDILKLFLTRIATVGLVIVSSLVVVTFPIELRNASALTVFTVGIPSALLALWAQPGHQVRDSLGPDARAVRRAGRRRVEPRRAARVLRRARPVEPRPDGARAGDAGNARTALTSFLVFVGLFLIVFVEPPITLVRGRRAAHRAIAARHTWPIGLGLGLRRRPAHAAGPRASSS